jgi:hypothetical protein
VTGPDAPPPADFTLAYVPGATPGKWAGVWRERFPGIPLTLAAVPAADAEGLLRERGADAGLVRLPVDRTVMSAIPLYTEVTVVVVPKDHLAAAFDEVTVADLADEVVLHPLDDTLEWERLPGRPAIERPATTPDALELVAAGIGVLITPLSLARLHHRRDLTYRTVADAPVSRVALAWPEEATTDLVEHFIGIVRGRTVNSSRGPKQPQGAGGAGRKQAAGAGGGTGARGQSGARTGAGKGGAAKGGAAKGSATRKPSASRKPGKAAPQRGKPRKRS